MTCSETDGTVRTAGRRGNRGQCCIYQTLVAGGTLTIPPAALFHISLAKSLLPYSIFIKRIPPIANLIPTGDHLSIGLKVIVLTVHLQPAEMSLTV